jgi:hypothetical protein
MSGERMSERFWFQHESGDRLYPYRIKNRTTGRVAFRAAPPGTGNNITENQIELDHEEDLYRYVFAMGWSTRMRSRSGSWNGLYNKDGRSIVLTSETGRNAPDAADYHTAFEKLPVSESERALLVAHYYAVGRCSSMEALAFAVGYDSYAPVNANYGKLARKIADALPSPPLDVVATGYGNQMQALATASVERSADEHFQWILRPEVAAALERLGWVSPDGLPAEEGGEIEGDPSEDVGATTRQTIVDARRGQGLFRARALQYWGGRCSVTRCANAPLLVASHIKPWATSNAAERLDGFNGLLLTPNLDKLFDRYLISFADDGRMLIADSLSVSDRVAFGLSAVMRIERLHERHQAYLKLHRALFDEA